MGPSFFLMPLAWIYQYFPAPLESVEKIVPGRTTINYGGRDYIMELADALNKRGIKLYLYYHLGNKDKEFWAATTQKGKLKEREAILESVFSNWKAIVSEVGNRYGKKLAGWWFDGGMSYYPTDFEELSKVARTGNPARMICFNAYKFPAFTEFADYMGGEMYGLSKVDKVVDFKCTGGKEKGLFAFALPRVENDWTTWKGSPKIIQKPNFDATRMVLRAHDKGYTLCMNLMSYSDGSFHPDTVKGIIKARKALEAKGIKRVFKPISQK